MDKIKTAKCCAVVTGLIGILVMAGWIFDIGFLKSILPVWVTMKFSTAVCFFASGIILYFIAKIRSQDAGAAVVAIPIAVLIILIFMTILFLSNITGLKIGIESLFVRENAGAVMTVSLGRPAVVTMLTFILIAIAGILALFKSTHLQKRLLLIGCVLIVVGGCAITGYILNSASMYYYVQGFSTAMALHSALVFVIIGAGFVLLGL